MSDKFENELHEKWARFFTDMKIKFQYKPKTFDQFDTWEGVEESGYGPNADPTREPDGCASSGGRPVEMYGAAVPFEYTPTFLLKPRLGTVWAGVFSSHKEYDQAQVALGGMLDFNSPLDEMTDSYREGGRVRAGFLILGQVPRPTRQTYHVSHWLVQHYKGLRVQQAHFYRDGLGVCDLTCGFCLKCRYAECFASCDSWQSSNGDAAPSSRCQHVTEGVIKTPFDEAHRAYWHAHTGDDDLS